ncbi:hypothetical protein F5Y14DRAFT_462510 [Nemania sp. NC0429]|nr:hypothetical protein F5Y14DRAFT_462510 [Nemania sp. NC0429]
MAQPYICLGNGVWHGKVSDVYLRWKPNASKWLKRHALELGDHELVLKALSEHLLCGLARRMFCDRATIKSTPYKLPQLTYSSNPDRKSTSLQMSGLVSRSWEQYFRHVRIFIEATSPSSMKHQRPELIGVSVFKTHHGDRTLEMNYSWGMGIEEWKGPVDVAYPGLSSTYSSSHGPSDTPPSIPDDAQAASPSLEGATPTNPLRRMNPKAVEFFPGSGRDEKPRIQPENYPSPRESSSPSSSISFLNQDSGDMCLNGSHDISVSPTADIPFSHDAPGWVGSPHIQPQAWEQDAHRDPYIHPQAWEYDAYKNPYIQPQAWEYNAYDMQPWGVPVPFTHYPNYNNYWINSVPMDYNCPPGPLLYGW